MREEGGVTVVWTIRKWGEETSGVLWVVNKGMG